MPSATPAETMLGRSDSGWQLVGRNSTAYCAAVQRWVDDTSPIHPINRHKAAVPPSVAPTHSLRLRCNSDPFHDEAKMFPKPKSVLVPNTYAFESEPMVKATGFREYDARWLFGKEINLMGIQALGMGLGALIAELGARQEVVTGHDFRSYSASIKYALISGLQAA